ncbi:2OG-Fe(II) oxygenase [Flavobacterium sp. CS20]|uniref:2OG-Fe(II) oxygenase n=1 Tax=Flavobacterium sp. CS20 TaxID=2775246 RepID=UPI001B3A777D|nr:2OG-Fe(II) oxygenase [Flavobacterium sp. CS20]QTY26368.1 2OG-Fe(II) oxygenase [Flavobacterium sp. CS20]
MTKTLLSEQLNGSFHKAYENIISQLQNQHYAVTDDFFDEELLEHLHQHILALYQADELKKAAIGKHFDEHIKTEIRGDYIQWINDKMPNEIELRFLNHIQQFIDYLNRTCFMGILHKEFHFAVYPQGRFYKRHLDTFQNDQRRKLSIVLYLNKNWSATNGGELVIYKQTNNQENAISILPKFGRLVVFESQVLEHEVKPIKQGLRLSILGWLKVR